MFSINKYMRIHGMLLPIWARLPVQLRAARAAVSISIKYRALHRLPRPRMYLTRINLPPKAPLVPAHHKKFSLKTNYRLKKQQLEEVQNRGIALRCYFTHKLKACATFVVPICPLRAGVRGGRSCGRTLPDSKGPACGFWRSGRLSRQLRC